MESYQVIFNGVPLAKYFDSIWETVHIPIFRTFRVENPKELYNEIDKFIHENNLRYSSYEINLI